MTRSILLVLLLSSMACSSDPGSDPPEGGGFEVAGNVGGASIDGVAAAFWLREDVREGQPNDDAYKFGGGSVTGTTFEVSFPSDPPPDALEPTGGMAQIIAFAPETSIPDGTWFSSMQDTPRLASSDPFWIVFSKDGALLDLTVPVGWSCIADLAPDDEDPFGPLGSVDCADVELAP